MSNVKSISWAILPDNTPSFLIDWELTLKCNLDCSYCISGPDGFHWKHGRMPSVEESIETIDFMYKYVDQYMKHRKQSQKKVVLNVYGGESLLHPDIIEILNEVRKRHVYDWELTVTVTTNAIINKKIWNKIITQVDEFSISYHAENLPKHQQLFLNNLLDAHNAKCRVKTIILMHPDTNLWEKSLECLRFCQKHNINHVVKSLDNYNEKFVYTKEQVDFLKKEIWDVDVEFKNKITVCNGRACCGGRKLSFNSELRSRETFVPRQNFEGWYCSVNWQFLYIRQDNGEVYTNKDCRTSLNGKVEPIGNLKDSQKILDELKEQFKSQLPVIKCVKKICLCGICATKAEDKEEFKTLMSRTLNNTNVLGV